MNGAISAFPLSLEAVAWRASVAITMWHLTLPRHFTRIDARIWQHFSMGQARRRGFEVLNGELKAEIRKRIA